MSWLNRVEESSVKRSKLVLVTASAAAFCVALSLTSCVGGCNSNQPTPPASPASNGPAANPSPEASASPEAKSTRKTTIYKVITGKGGMGQLQAVEVDLDPNEVQTAVVALNKMAEEKDSPLPKDTRALSIRFEGDGLATVNFSPELSKNFEGGDTREALMFNAILATVGQFGDVKRVQILVNGQKEQIGGTQDTTKPLDIPDDPNAAPKSEP